MKLIEKYLYKTGFDSYEDFSENFKIKTPDSFNFGYDVVDYWAENEPEKIALVYVDDHNNKKIFTFKDIKLLSDKAANFFISKGIKKGDTVMLTLKRRYQFWYLITALHKIGAVAIPATEQLKTKEYKYRIQAAKVKMILTIDEDVIVSSVNEAVKEFPWVKKGLVCGCDYEGWIDVDKEVENSSPIFEKPKDYPHNEDYFLLYFTSGTTGNPKMVIHNCFYPLGHIATAKYWHGVRENGLHFAVADTGWAKCAWGKIYGQWICGCAIMVYDMDRFVPENLLKIMQEYPITSFCAPPTIFRFLIRADIKPKSLSHIRQCTTAGEPLNPQVYKIWKEKTGLSIREGFGQSESTVMLGTFIWMEPRLGSMGKPCPIYDIDLVKKDGTWCEEGDEGEIAVKLDKEHPKGLFAGYYLDEERTKEAFKDEMYRVGDLAYKDTDGYYWYIGRADDVIKSSGYRIGPFEVESALMQHPCVLECAITGVPDEIRGQVVKATIVLGKYFSPSDELIKELQEHVKNTTAPYKYPRVIEFVNELPKTTSGKIQRFKIRQNHNPKK